MPNSSHCWPICYSLITVMQTLLPLRRSGQQQGALAEPGAGSKQHRGCNLKMSTSAAAGCNGVATQGLRTGAWSRAREPHSGARARSVLPLTCRKENVWPSHIHMHAPLAGWLAAALTHSPAEYRENVVRRVYTYVQGGSIPHIHYMQPATPTPGHAHPC